MSRKKKEPSLTDRMESSIRAALAEFGAAVRDEEEFVSSALSALELVRLGLQMRLQEIEKEASEEEEGDP